ncbi:MAG: rod shape-determining protein [Parcubacteria group bacterium]|nr:rod shape-determining protein [Parcubacteria group bacterium]
MFVTKIAIDLGTANTLVYVPRRGVIINEPSVVAIAVDDRRILAIGTEALAMLGKTPDTIRAARPLKDGVIADYRVTEAMLRYFIGKVAGSIRLLRPDVMVAVPAGVTSTERRAVIDATLQAGARAAYIIKEPVAAAIGAGVPIGTPSGNMVVTIGAGITEVAVISLGGIVASSSVRIGGQRLDTAIAEYIRKKYGLIVGEHTVEELKKNIGSAIVLEEPLESDIRGRDSISGLPKTIRINSTDVTEAIQEELKEIIATIKQVLAHTPPELSSDIIDRGIILTGGGALLRHTDRLLAEATGVPCYMADEPLLAVAKGAGIALEHLESYKRSVLVVR